MNRLTTILVALLLPFVAEAETLGSTWHGAAGGRLHYAVAPRFVLSCTPAMMTGCRDLARRHGIELCHMANSAAILD